MRENFKVLPTDEKLDLLVKHYDLLIKSDKSRKSNRTGKQQICRMKGSVTQSYFILDVPSNKVARQIYYEFAEDNRDNSLALKNDD
jgi:hypothetical protein